MTDRTLKYSIDARSAEAGARQFVKAVKSIRTNSRASIDATTKDFERLKSAISGANFSKMVSEVSKLSRVKFSSRGMSNYVAMLREISAFKGPSQAAITRLNNLSKAVANIARANGGKGASVIQQIAQAVKSLESIGNAASHMKTLKTAISSMTRIKPQNLEKLGLFFQMLKAVRISNDLYKLTAISAALRDFRPPTSARVDNMDRFLDRIQRARVPNGLAAGLMGLGNSMRAFRPPTASQIERFKQFVTFLNTVQLRKDFGPMAAGLDRIATAATRSSRAFGMMRKSMTGIPFSRTTRNIHGMTGALRGLENAFSLSYHAGSLFRTMIGALSLGTFAKSVFDTSVMYLKADAAFRVVTSSQEEATQEMAEAIAMIQRTGGAIDTVLPRYSKFVAAAGQSGLTVGEARDIFESVSGALTVLGANAEDSELAFLAIEQIISKGVLSSEELRRQLAERLPGAFQAMAKALYPNIVATEGMEAAQRKLNEELKKGNISSIEAMQRFAQVLDETYGDELGEALKRPDVALNRLRNQWTFFKKTVADSGFLYELGIAFDKLTVAMQTDQFRQFAITLGEGLGRAVRGIGDAAVWTIENMDKVKESLKAILIAAVAYKSVNLGASIIQSGTNFAIMAKNIWGATKALGAATGASKALRLAMLSIPFVAILAAGAALAAILYKNRDATYMLGDEMVTVGETVKAVWDLIVKGVTTGLNFVMGAFDTYNKYLGGIWGDIELDFGSMIENMIWAIDQFFNHWDNMLNKVDRGWSKLGENVKLSGSGIANAIGLKSDEELRADVMQYRSNNAAIDQNFFGRQSDIFSRDGIITRQIKENRAKNSLRGTLGGEEAKTIDPRKANLKLFTDDYDPSKGKDDDKAAAKRLANINKLIERMLPMKTAVTELAASEKMLLEAHKKKLITDKELAQAQQNLRTEYEAQIDPVKGLISETERNIALTRQTMDAAPGIKEYYEFMAKLRHENAEAQADENKELREKMRLEASLERFSSIRDNLNPLAAARRDYGLDRQAVLDAVPAGPERDRMLERLKKQSRDATDPVGAMQRRFAESRATSGMDETSARRYAAIRDEINTLEEAGVDITSDLIRNVSEMVILQDKMDNPTGFRQWIDEARTLSEVMSDLSTTVGDELAGSFAKLFATGDFEMTDFLTAIRDEAAQGAGELVTKDIMNEVGLGNKGGLIGGLKKGAMSLFDGKEGNFLSSFQSGYSEIKKDELSKGDYAIVTVLEQIRDTLNGDSGTGAAGGLSDLFNNGGIFGDLLGGGAGGAGGMLGGLMGGGGGGIGGMLGGLMGGGGGGIGGMLGGLMGGGGGGDATSGILSAAGTGIGAMFGMPGIGGQIGSLLSGFFEEGGITGSAVAHGMAPMSAFNSAPRLAVGTPNISSGEHPAILHDDEAVIPLSRGRYVPVQMRGGEAKGGNTTQQSVVFNIQAKDPNEFRRSEHQLKSRAARSLRSVA